MVMGGLLSEKFLDTNLAIPFAGPPLNTPSLQKYINGYEVLEHNFTEVYTISLWKLWTLIN